MPKLTRSMISAAAPRARRYWLWDQQMPGLGLLVLPTGRKAWCLRYRTAGGRPRQMTLGSPAELTPEQARELAGERLRDVRRGADPLRERTRLRALPTVEALFDGYLAQMRANGRRSAGTVQRELRKAADALGAQTLAAEVGAGDVSDYLGRIYRRGSRVMADRARAYLHAAFQWGAEATHDYRAAGRQDWGIKANPVALVPRDADAIRARDRALSAAEVRAVWQATAGEPFAPDTGAAVRLLIACGQRVRETLRARGADFDLEAAVWTLPPSTTKGGKPHAIPLPPQAVDVVRELVQRHGAGPLFPGRGTESHLSDGSINRALARSRAITGVERFQTRDLRRTWKSRAGDAGVDRFTRDLIQQHATKGDTGSRHYDRADYMPQMRAAMLRWGAWLQATIEGRPVSVVPIKKTAG